MDGGAPLGIEEDVGTGLGLATGLGIGSEYS